MTYTISKNRIICDGNYTGYTLSRGGFVGTSDDKIDGWYIDHDDADILDRRGPGHPTKQAALQAYTNQGENA